MSTTVTHVWKPSHARVVTIDSFIPVSRGATAVAPSPLTWPTKDPGDVLDYVLDIAPAIIGNDGDSISNVTVGISPANPGDLTLQSTTVDGSHIVLWLAAGQAGTVYTITVALTTVTGRSLQRSVLLPVLLMSVPTIPPNAILTTTGVMLTDQNGNPVLSTS